MNIKDSGLGHSLLTGPSVGQSVLVKLLLDGHLLSTRPSVLSLPPPLETMYALDASLVPSASPGGMWREWQRWRE